MNINIGQDDCELYIGQSHGLPIIPSNESPVVHYYNWRHYTSYTENYVPLSPDGTIISVDPVTHYATIPFNSVEGSFEGNSIAYNNQVTVNNLKLKTKFSVTAINSSEVHTVLTIMSDSFMRIVNSQGNLMLGTHDWQDWYTLWENVQENTEYTIQVDTDQSGMLIFTVSNGVNEIATQTTVNVSELTTFYGIWIGPDWGTYTTESTFNINLPNTFIEINNTHWTPLSETYVDKYTLDYLPNLSSTVYDSPEISSALTITSIGTDRITLSDNNTYVYNMSGDIEPSSGTVLHQFDRVDGKATVAGFFTDGNGQRYAVCLPDARFRTYDSNTARMFVWSTDTSTDTPLTNYASLDELTYAQESGTYNTNLFIQTYPSQLSSRNAFYIATEGYCKASVIVDGKTFNSCLPNLPEIRILYPIISQLDELDPTEEGIGIRISDIWGAFSSNECDSSTVWCVAGLATRPTWITRSKNNGNVRGVVSMIEIPVDENGVVQ
jgi:hypothetical protein